MASIGKYAWHCLCQVAATTDQLLYTPVSGVFTRCLLWYIYSNNFISSQTIRSLVGALIRIPLFLAVLGASVLSKLTVLSLTDKLRSVTTNVSSAGIITSQENQVTTTSIYWYLQFIVLIPSLITLIRCLLFGVLGKTSKSFPLPTWKAIVIVSYWRGENLRTINNIIFILI